MEFETSAEISNSSIWKHTSCATRVCFLPLFFATSTNNEVQMFTALLFYAYVKIHQVRRLVFHKKVPMPLILYFCFVPSCMRRITCYCRKIFYELLTKIPTTNHYSYKFFINSVLLVSMVINWQMNNKSYIRVVFKVKLSVCVFQFDIAVGLTIIGLRAPSPDNNSNIYKTSFWKIILAHWVLTCHVCFKRILTMWCFFGLFVQHVVRILKSKTSSTSETS